MRKIYHYLVLLVLCAISIPGQGQVTFNNITVDHNVTQNGEKGMLIHVNFNIEGYKGQQCNMNAYFYYSNGNRVEDVNNRYCTTDGQAATHLSFTPNYDNSVFSDMQLFFPYNELHLRKGDHSLKFYLQAYRNGKSINNSSNYISFTVSQPSDNSQRPIAYMDIHKKYSHSEYFGGDRVVRSEKRSDKGYMFYYANGWEELIIITQSSCSSCGGSGKCRMCNGTGQYYIGSMVSLCVCMGSGTCGSCHGKSAVVARTATHKENHLLYCSFTGERGTVTSTDTPPPTVDYNAGGSNSYNSGSYNSGSNKVPCSICGGSGKCSSCAGRGESRNPYSGTLHDCDMCKGGGRCQVCRGRKYL